MEQEREENGKLLLAVSVSSEKVPEMPLRDKIRQLVNKYASALIRDSKMCGIRFTTSFIIYTIYQYATTRK